MINAVDIIFEELEDLRNRIISNIDSTGRKASGKTGNSMRVDRQEDGCVLVGRRAFSTLEDGRKPGAVPANFRSIIKQWILDKGISYNAIPYKRIPSEKWQPKYTPAERGLMSLSGAIAYKIAKEGTSLYRAGGDNDVYSNEIPYVIENIKKRLGSAFKTEVLKSIKINN